MRGKWIKKGPVTDEIATAEKDITRDYIGKILSNPDKVLRSESGGKGIEIYEDFLTHHRIFSEMQKRILAVTGKEWQVIPASDSSEDQKIAKFVTDVFLSCNYDLGRQALLTGVITGFKPAEIMWDNSEGDIWIKEIRGRSPRRFCFDLKSNLRLLTWKNMIEGEELPDRKFVIFRNGANNASPYGDGLGRPLYWCQWFARNGVKFWAVFLEKFGQPTPWGKYPSGTEKSQQDKLLDALEAMQTESCIITPDNMVVDLLEATRTSSIDSYAKWAEYWDSAITIVILGQTATTIGTPGKLGGEEARSEVRKEYTKADADLLCECQNNSLIPWLVDYNFPGVKKYPKVWIRTKKEQDLKPLAERDKILIADLGLPTAKNYLYEIFGIPKPQPGEELISVSQVSPLIGFEEGSA
jgi:phage gp29-like protein